MQGLVLSADAPLYGRAHEIIHLGPLAPHYITSAFHNLWFRVVAPNRAFLATANRSGKLGLLRKHWPTHLGAVWEDFCRSAVSRLRKEKGKAFLGSWGPASRWWRGDAPEWDVVAHSTDGQRLLLGEAKWKERSFSRIELERAANQLRKKTPPQLPKGLAQCEQVRVLFVPAATRSSPVEIEGISISTEDSFAPVQ